MMNFEAEILSKLDCSEIINKHILYKYIVRKFLQQQQPKCCLLPEVCGKRQKILRASHITKCSCAE